MVEGQVTLEEASWVVERLEQDVVLFDPYDPYGERLRHALSLWIGVRQDIAMGAVIHERPTPAYEDI